MIRYTIYVIDDETAITESVYVGLKKDYEVKTFSSGESAIQAIKEDPPDLALLDIGLPGMDGIEVLRKTKALNPDVLVIMITGYEDIDTVISAMKFGAYDYIVKPLNMHSLRIRIKKALEAIIMRKEIQALQEKYLDENLPCFVGESKTIQRVMLFVDKVAKSPDTPILILGETGTGKELIANAIHYKSPHFRGPFVSLNCAAIPKDLLESELFGYDKGAFSGADPSGKKGLVEEAANGTLFLDEVAELSLGAQAKLLRFLEEGEYYRVGGTKKLRTKARIISSTNRDLDCMVEERLFRRDLYYRLAVIKVEVPSLNKRREDIIPIAKYFLVTLSKNHSKFFTGLSSRTEQFLKNYEYKGNVRELRNLVERGVLVGNGPELTLQHIGVQNGNQHETSKSRGLTCGGDSENRFPPLPEDGIDLNSLEEYYIREAFEKCGGNETKAAQLLGLTYFSYRYRRKKIKDLRS